jgi:nicotinamide phosphoribosyltransferase
MNLILQTDSYKPTHWPQYPPKTQKILSYLESRGGQFVYTVFFGLQYILKEYLAGFKVQWDDIEQAKKFFAEHYGNDKLFNESGWKLLMNRYHGKLPLEIKAVAEGSVVPCHNVLMTIENTDPDFYWLTNYVESLLLKVWYPITVATQSRVIKELILAYLESTGDTSTINFKLHDFGYRGVSSEESAAIGGAAHLVNFMGSDTISGINLIRKYYNTAAMPAFAIPASEHSTITSWGREHEADAMENMLDKYPEGLVACVSDSYDIENACRNIWGTQLRDKILKRKGTLVVRPDSGDPKTIVLKCLNILGEQFGTTVNEKGYKVLHPNIRVIQGDGVNYHSINAILKEMADNGWSADNIAFGMGGALLQQLNRDTQKFAIKCSNAVIDGKDVPVWKDPVTDTGKVSKKGRLALVMDSNNSYHTIQLQSEIGSPDDLLETVFLNGKVTKEYTFESIRERATVQLLEAVSA